MDIVFLASVRCAHTLQGGTKDGKQCGREREHSKLAGPDDTYAAFAEEARVAFQKQGWLVGPAKSCRCPDHN